MKIIRHLVMVALCGVTAMPFVVAGQTTAPAAASAEISSQKRTESPLATQPDAGPEVKIPRIQLKVFSVELKSKLGMDHTGKVVDLQAQMDIGFGIMFPDADKHFIAYEDVVLDQVVTSAGEILPPIRDVQTAGDSMWATFSQRQKVAHRFFFLPVNLPIQPAGQISKITGHVHLDLGLGGLAEQTLDQFTDAPSRTIVLKEFPDAPIEFARSKWSTGIDVAVDPALNSHLLNIFFYDKNGKHIKAGGMSGEGVKNGKIRRTVHVKLPDDGSIKVFYYLKIQKYRWAFEINNVPMPQSVRINSQHTVVVDLKAVPPKPVPAELDTDTDN